MFLITLSFFLSHKNLITFGRIEHVFFFCSFPTRFTRETKENCDIKGVKISENSGVIVSTMSLHRDPKYWSEPDKFDPER